MEQDRRKQKSETADTTNDNPNTSTKKTAVTSASKNAPHDSGNGGQTQSIPQELESELQSAGYSEVKVIPRSYVVSAKDPEGNPSVMLIGPYAFEAVTFYKSSAPAQET